MKRIKRVNWADYKDKKILIYGAHLVALEVYRDICRAGFKDSVIGFAVTYKDDNPEAVEDLPVRKLSDYKRDAAETVVVIAMPSKFHEEVKNYSREHGFTEYIGITLEDMSEIRGAQLIETWDEDFLRSGQASMTRRGWMESELRRMKWLSLNFQRSFILMKASERENRGEQSC